MSKQYDSKDESAKQQEVNIFSILPYPAVRSCHSMTSVVRVWQRCLDLCSLKGRQNGFWVTTDRGYTHSL